MKMVRMQAHSVSWLISCILLPLLSLIPVSRQGGDLRVVTGVQRPSLRDKRFNERLMFEDHTVQTLFLCLGQCDRYPDCIGIFYNKLNNNCTGHNIVFGHEAGAIQDGGSRYYVKNNVRGYIGDACNINSDCSVVQSECRDNTCLCFPGYSFSPKTGQCLAIGPCPQSCQLPSLPGVYIRRRLGHYDIYFLVYEPLNKRSLNNQIERTSTFQAILSQSEDCTKYGNNFLKVAYHFISGNNQDAFLGVSEEDCKFLCLNRTSYICRTFEFGRYQGVDECYLSTITSLDAPSQWFYDTSQIYSYYQRDCD